MIVMPTPSSPRRARLWTIVPLLLVALGFVFATPWIKSTFGATTVGLTAALLAVVVMGYANFLAYRYEAGLDEVQRAGSSFATKWGASAGQFAFVVLMILPPVRDFVVETVIGLSGDPGAGLDGRATAIGFIFFGFCGVVLLQALGTLVFSVIWFRSKQ
jgi:hypothetical protein